MYNEIKDEARRDIQKWGNPGNVENGYRYACCCFTCCCVACCCFACPPAPALSPNASFECWD